ncbi:uncharacterized protein LOC135845296 isoform X2 [Planococcus citri]|uniref:uncharacterized protein LOC135845296 isoform X2 n=1 Tax=Planococcus citri TaxID=170843 RepID=UPI0031F7AF69
MKKWSFFGLLCFASLVKSEVLVGGRRMNEYIAIENHNEMMMIFRQAMGIELFSNGKYMNNPLYSKLGIKDFMKYCADILKEFDDELSIEPHEVIFKSFYYKTLKWLNHHLSRIEDIAVVNNELNDCVNDIIKKREISKDIMTAFDERIYEIKVPKQLILFGEEVDKAIQLIYDVESREIYINGYDEEMQRNTHSFDDDGRKKFFALISVHLVRCKEIEVYENFIRKLDNNEDYSDYVASSRKLKIMGLVDVALIYFRGGYQKDFNYESINLDDFPRGTVGHFKLASLLFLQAFEHCVFHKTLGALAGDSYLFQRAFIENFSTRNKAFYLRLCSLNLQVQITLDNFLQVFVWYSDKLQDLSLKATAYRLLKWFSKYAKFRACSYTEVKINEIFSKLQEINPITDVSVLNLRVPSGINNLQKLKDFGEKEENIVEGSFLEEDDNNDVYVPEEVSQNAENSFHEEMTDKLPTEPQEIIEIEPVPEIIEIEREEPLKTPPHSDHSLGRSTSYIDIQFWIDGIKNFLTGPSFLNIKNSVMGKLKSFL